MRSWLLYGAASLLLVVFGIGLVLAAGSGGAGAWRAVVIAGVVAWVLQLGAFGLLQRYRGVPNGFLMAWAGGIAARFGVVGLVAWWSSGRADLPREPLLLSLVGFMFMLLLVEPVFLRRGPSGR